MRNATAPADIIGMNGYMPLGVYMHISRYRRAATRLAVISKPNTNVFTFAVITLGVLNTDADLSRFDDQAFR
ncbi:MAG: hypothetical protein JO033_23755 [Acidobacteriaceae bacterium]|nr:hypothetical protein [Acidobacteriaceae bacterium]MBV9502713.1 hypothetical protein [Acidobacteriaceae bacterium]